MHLDSAPGSSIGPSAPRRRIRPADDAVRALASAVVCCQGASLDEAGDMLRHRSRVSRMIYAKLDIEGLVARGAL
jgi:hypothetical protein